MSEATEELERLAETAACGPAQGLTAAELHGATVGIAVTDPGRFELQELVHLLGADALSDGEAVASFVEAALEGLHAPDMSFSLLLPDDGTSREARLSALALWCQSFLAGLAAGLARRGISSLASLPEDAREIVRDFAAIAQLDPEDEAGGESDFMQLEEYVKVGALLIMSLADPDADADAADDSES